MIQDQTLPNPLEKTHKKRVDGAEKKRELLTLKVQDLYYAIPINQVREIRGWTHPTPLPNSATFIRGVINLRGLVLPILDLAVRLGGDATDENNRSVIIVCEYDDQIMGLLVDAVSDILTLPESQIQSPAILSGTAETALIAGLVEVEGNVVRLLNLPLVLDSQNPVSAL